MLGIKAEKAICNITSPLTARFESHHRNKGLMLDHCSVMSRIQTEFSDV
jgi:hypothetical protein